MAAFVPTRVSCHRQRPGFELKLHAVVADGAGERRFLAALVGWTEVVVVTRQAQKRIPANKTFQSIRTTIRKANKVNADWFIMGIELAGYGKVGR